MDPKNPNPYLPEFDSREELIPAEKLLHNGEKTEAFSLRRLQRALIGEVSKGKVLNLLTVLRELLAYDEVRAVFHKANIDVDGLRAGIGSHDSHWQQQQKRAETRRRNAMGTESYVAYKADKHNSAGREETVHEFIRDLKLRSLVNSKREPGAVEILKMILMEQNDLYGHCNLDVFKHLKITPARLFPELKPPSQGGEYDELEYEREKAAVLADELAKRGIRAIGIIEEDRNHSGHRHRKRHPRDRNGNQDHHPRNLPGDGGPSRYPNDGHSGRNEGEKGR